MSCVRILAQSHLSLVTTSLTIGVYLCQEFLGRKVGYTNTQVAKILSQVASGTVVINAWDLASRNLSADGAWEDQHFSLVIKGYFVSKLSTGPGKYHKEHRWTEPT